MAATTTTTYASTIQTRWEKDLLMTADGYLIADKDANTKVMGKGDGNTVRINKILRPANVTTADTAGTLIAPASAKALTSNYIDFNMEIWGDSYAFNEDVDVQSFVSDKDNMDVIARQMADSLDYQVMKKLATEGMRHRIDASVTYQVSGTVDTTSLNSTTVMYDAARTEATNFFNGGFLTVTNPGGPNYDVTRQVSDFNATTDLTTTAAFNHAPTSSSNYRMTVGTGIAATDKLSSAGLLAVSALHEAVQTEKFNGGVYRAFISPAQHADLWTDTDFKASATYNSEGGARWKTIQLVRWFDIEFGITSNIYRETVAGVESSTGVVYVSPIYGKNSYTVIRYGNPGGSGKFAVKFYIVDQPDSQNLRNSAKYMSWKGMWAGGVTRATSCIGLMTGATDQGIIV